MKKFHLTNRYCTVLLTTIMMLAGSTTQAQEVNRQVVQDYSKQGSLKSDGQHPTIETDNERLQDTETLTLKRPLAKDSVHLVVPPMEPSFTAGIDSIHLPEINYMGMVRPLGFVSPYYCGSHWGNWRLHQGLNLSIGASVFSQFGKHARGGVGFTQNIAGLYVAPLSEKLTLAVGGYFANTFWNHDNFRDAGLTAVLGYRFDEHWEAFLYGQKSIASNVVIPYYIQDISDLGDRIGAAVRYNFSPSFSVQMSVESCRLNNVPVYSFDRPKGIPPTR